MISSRKPGRRQQPVCRRAAAIPGRKRNTSAPVGMVEASQGTVASIRTARGEILAGCGNAACLRPYDTTASRIRLSAATAGCSSEEIASAGVRVAMARASSTIASPEGRFRGPRLRSVIFGQRSFRGDQAFFDQDSCQGACQCGSLPGGRTHRQERRRTDSEGSIWINRRSGSPVPAARAAPQSGEAAGAPQPSSSGAPKLTNGARAFQVVAQGCGRHAAPGRIGREPADLGGGRGHVRSVTPWRTRGAVRMRRGRGVRPPPSPGLPRRPFGTRQRRLPWSRAGRRAGLHARGADANSAGARRRPGAERSAGDRVSRSAGDSHREPGRHPYLQAAAVGTEPAGGRFTSTGPRAGCGIHGQFASRWRCRPTVSTARE